MLVVAARRIEDGWFKQTQISWKTKHNVFGGFNGIWSNGNNAPEEIYLAFDVSDQGYWAGKLPIKPQRKESAHLCPLVAGQG